MDLWGKFKAFFAPRPRKCGYGDSIGAEGNCTVIVNPGEGVRYAGTPFCSEEHAAMDQQEALI